MSTATRAERHRADPAKANGVVYTPPALARFLASRALDAAGDLKPLRVLDPACGDGELLLATCQLAKEREIEITEVIGYDVDPGAIEAAYARLNERTPIHLHCEDFLESAYRRSKGANLFDPCPANLSDSFNLVISNPPYVRTQTLGTNVAQLLGSQFGLTGRVDLYQAFAIAMIQSLSPQGALGLLCSNKFLTNRAGNSMRQFLLRELEIEELIDLGDTKLFDAAVLPVIISGRRRHDSTDTGARRFRSVYETTTQRADDTQRVSSILTALTDDLSGPVTDSKRSYVIRDGLLNPGDESRDPWNPVDSERLANLQVIRRTDSLPLRELAKVRVGVKTTADSIFIRSDWATLEDQVRPEEELLHPLITHRDIRAWSCEPGRRRILYPHNDDAGRTVAVDLDRYPRASAYLNQHRRRLASRDYVKKSARKWFEIWVPQKPALWSRQKIVFPDISESPRFSIDRTGAIVNGDCYWMVVDDEDLAEIITAVGNSSFCTWFYDTVCGNFLYAGRRRFMTQYIERLPIPRPTSNLIRRIRECRFDENYAEVNRLVWSSLGFKEFPR